MMPLQTRSVYVRMMPVQTICIEDSAQVCCHGWREPWSVLKGGRPVHKGISLHALARSCGPLSCTWFHPPDDADNPICLCLLWTTWHIHKCLSHDQGCEDTHWEISYVRSGRLGHPRNYAGDTADQHYGSGAAAPAPDLQHQPQGSTHFGKQNVRVGYTRYIYIIISFLFRVYPVDMT